MQELFLTVFYFIFFVYLYLPFLLEEDEKTKTMEEKVQQLEEKVQILKAKASRVSNAVTDSPYFAQVCDWAYSVCDPEGTNHIGKAELYSGILMVHIKLAKLTGVSATFPPDRATVSQLFDACDTNGSGGINREEFDIFLSSSSAQIFGRILINLITYIFVIPYYSKHIVDSFGIREGSYWEVVAEQACGLFLFFVIVPIFWGMVDDKSTQTASRKAERHREIKATKTD